MSRTRTETPERHLMKRHRHSQVFSLVLCSVWKHILVKETSLWSSVWRKESSTSAVRWDWCLSVCLQLRSLEKKNKKTWITRQIKAWAQRRQVNFSTSVHTSDTTVLQGGGVRGGRLASWLSVCLGHDHRNQGESNIRPMAQNWPARWVSIRPVLYILKMKQKVQTLQGGKRGLFVVYLCWHLVRLNVTPVWPLWYKQYKQNRKEKNRRRLGF